MSTQPDYATQYIGKVIQIKIDRKLGSTHPKYNFTYEVNYGFVPNTQAPDDEEIDVYLLAVNEPVNNYSGKCIAVIHRLNDDDDKLIVVPTDVSNLTDDEIKKSTFFQEQFFSSIILR